MADLPTKWQAFDAFWSSFGWAAYDENTVLDNAGNKYITYESATGSLDDSLYLSASLWHINATAWDVLDKKEIEIEKTIGYNCYILPVQGGQMVIRRGSPFAQRMQDAAEKRTRRVLLNIVVEFITA